MTRLRKIFAVIVSAAFIIGIALIIPFGKEVSVGGTFVSHDRKVNIKEGGVVKEVVVKENQKVKAQDILVRLDGNAADVAAQINEIQIKIARLVAERYGGKLSLPTDAPGKKIDQDVSRKAAEARITQLERQIADAEKQIRQNLLNRHRIRYSNKALEADIKSDKARIEEIKQQTQQASETSSADAVKELDEASVKLGQLIVRQDVQYIDVFTPMAGTVRDIKIRAGGVVNPGEAIMTILPDDDALEVAVKLAAAKIDQFRLGQHARVKLLAFMQDIPDIMTGTVKFISHDRLESKAGAYYEARIGIDKIPDGATLAQGMPAEVFIETDKSTMLSYLASRVPRSWREMSVER